MDSVLKILTVFIYNIYQQTSILKEQVKLTYVVSPISTLTLSPLYIQFTMDIFFLGYLDSDKDSRFGFE